MVAACGPKYASATSRNASALHSAEGDATLPRMIRSLVALVMTLQAVFALDLRPLDEVAVQEGGRKKPFLVFAEESLMGISGKTALTVGERKMGAREIIMAL